MRGFVYKLVVWYTVFIIVSALVHLNTNFMRQSKYFLKTSKTVSDDDSIASTRLLKQAGFIKESVAGRYYFLPIGQRVQQKIMALVKAEMDKAGSQEMLAPVLHPLELWKETNRTNTASFELMRVKDRRGGEFALGGTAEEMFVDLVRKFTISYRDLPFSLYQFSTKFRDELRARGGLLRVREFIMKDAYSFHADESDFRREYTAMKEVYTAIFQKMGLETYVVESDNGYIGGEYCHEFVVETEVGESRFFSTSSGDYNSHEDTAVAKKEEKNLAEEEKPLQEVDAVRGTTMEDGVNLHKLPLWQQTKDVLFVDEKGRFILALIRGDYDVNEVKLCHLVKAIELRTATEEEVREIIGSEPGFISPVGIRECIKKDIEFVLVADDSMRTVKNMYGGANKLHKDLLNINIDRDWQADIEGDIALVREGDISIQTGEKLLEKRGIEVGNIFQLGYHYTNLMKGAVFTDEQGGERPYYMGCYGIGIGRTLATIVEKHHDEKGIVWPEAVAPFKVHLLSLLGKDVEKVTQEADRVYKALLDAGVEVLYDDRAEVSNGEKFADSDLLGIPWRVVVSAKTLEKECVEIKKRNSSEASVVSFEEFLKILA